MKRPEPDDFALMKATAEGDTRAFEALYDRFASIVLGMTARILASRAEAEEVLQESFWQVWKEARSFQPALGSPYTWIVTIARRKAIDRLRSNARHLQRIQKRLADEMAAEYDAPTGAGHASASDAATLVRQALAKLRPEEKCAIELAFFDGLTHSEIAAALGVPDGTVKARIRRGMAKLRRPLESLRGLSNA